MDLTFEVVAVSAIFLLPGYAARSITGHFKKTPRRASTTLDSVLTSLGLTIVVVASLAFLATCVGSVVWLIREDWIEHLKLDILVRSGLDDYIIERPWVVIFSIPSFALATTVLSIVIGLTDPLEHLLQRRQLSHGLISEDMWSFATTTELERLGYERCYVQLTIKESGDLVSGTLRGLSIPSEEHPDRDIYLQRDIP